MAKKSNAMRGVTCKNGYWYARTANGVEYFGAGTEGKQLAEAARAKFLVEKYENRQVRAGMKVKKINVKTFAELCNWYMTLPSIQSMKIYGRRVFIAANLLKFFGEKRLSNITVDDQEGYRQHREAAGMASGTIDLELNLFSAIYNLAAKRKMIPADLVPGEILRENKSDPRPIISEADFNAILGHCNADLADFLTCGYESAMRINEIAGLTPAQVKIDIRHISGAVLDYIDLGIFDTKTGARRMVPVSAKLKAILVRRMAGLEPEDRIFTNGRGGKWTSPHIATVLRPACEKAGVPYGDRARDKKGNRIGIVFHCLRHTRTSLWITQGYSDEIVRRATGHATLAAYQKYVKLDPAVVMRLVSNQEAETGQKQDKTAVNSYQ